MALADDIRTLRDRVLADLDSAHDSDTDTTVAWILVRNAVGSGQKFTYRNSATGTETTQDALVSRAQGYVARQVAESTFQDFVSFFEAPDKEAIIAFVVGKEAKEVMDDRPSGWFE